MKAEAAVAARTTDLLDDEAAAAIRSAREAAWSTHRAALDRASADLFEAAMGRNDAAGRRETGQRARARRAARARDQDRRELEAECARTKADLEAAEKTIGALGHEIAALRPRLLRRDADALAFINTWRVRRDKALTLAEASRELADAKRHAEDDGTHAPSGCARPCEPRASAMYDDDASLDD